MAEQLPFLMETYSALAPVYDQAGMADFVLDAVPQYITLAQTLDWAGRQILDLGCGTGQSTWWLANEGFRVVGIDSNPHMLAQAQAPPHSDDFGMSPPDFSQQDVRQLNSPIGEVDLVLAVGLINSLQSLRELETVFSRVNQTLSDDRFFIFDARTIRGMALDQSDDNLVYYDDGHSLAIMVRNQFSFETLSSTRHFIIFRREEGSRWKREDEIHVERGYPTQGIAAMLERTGFDIVTVLTDALESFDIKRDAPDRVVFVAQKTS